MTTCPACDENVHDGAAFCTSCGAAMDIAPRSQPDLPTTAPTPAPPTPAGATSSAPGPPPSRRSMSTAQFVLLATLLIALIVATAGVYAVATQSGGKNKSNQSARDDAVSPDVTGSTTSTEPSTEPSATANTVSVPIFGVTFGAPAVLVGHPLTISVREKTGIGIDDASLTVDGKHAPVKWTKTKATWNSTWATPPRPGRHSLRVTVSANGRTKNVTQVTTVRLPAPVAAGLARIQTLIDAFAVPDGPTINAIQVSPPESLDGYADVNDGHVLYVSHSSPSPNIYAIRGAYVIHQTVPPGEVGAGQQDTAFFCVTFVVDDNHPGPNVTFTNVKTIEQRTTDKWPGNAPPGWLSFDSYETRLDECA